MRKIVLLVSVCLLTSALSVQGGIPPLAELPPVTIENVDQLVQLERLGHGTVGHMDWHPDGEVAAFGGGWGVWLLDESFNPVAHFGNIPETLDLAWHPTASVLATLHATAIHFWRITEDFSTATLEHTLSIAAAPFSNTRFLSRCLAWSRDATLIGIGRQPYDSEDVPTSGPPPFAEFVVYDTAASTLSTASDPELENELIARCRRGTVSPDGELTTYIEYDYLAGSTFSRFKIVRQSAPEGEAAAEDTLPTLAIDGMDWHPSGEYLTLIHEHELYNYTYPALELISTSRFFNGGFSSTAWSPDGRRLLASYGFSPHTSVWNFEGEAVTELQLTLNFAREDQGFVWWAEDREQLIARTFEYGYQRFDVIDAATGQRIRRISAVLDTWQGEDTWHYLWNADYTRVAYFDPLTEGIRIGEFPGKPDNAYWDSALDRFVVGQWTNGQPLVETPLPGTFPDFRRFQWQGDTLLVIVADDAYNETVYRWTPETGTYTEVGLPRQRTPYAINLHFYGTNDRFTPTYRYDLIIQEAASGRVFAIHRDQPAPHAFVGEGANPHIGLAVHPHAPILAIAVRGGLRLWSLEDGSLLGKIATESDIASLDWHPSGNLLAGASPDGTVYLFGLDAQ